MTCEKTGRLWEESYFVYGTDPVLVHNYNTPTTLGLFTTTEDCATCLCALTEIRRWLETETRNPGGIIYETPTQWLIPLNHSLTAQKLGFLLSPADTIKFITLIYGDLYPFWGDINSEQLEYFVDLSDISTELAESLHYTVHTTND